MTFDRRERGERFSTLTFHSLSLSSYAYSLCQSKTSSFQKKKNIQLIFLLFSFQYYPRPRSYPRIVGEIEGLPREAAPIYVSQPLHEAKILDDSFLPQGKFSYYLYRINRENSFSSFQRKNFYCQFYCYILLGMSRFYGRSGFCFSHIITEERRGGSVAYFNFHHIINICANGLIFLTEVLLSLKDPCTRVACFMMYGGTVLFINFFFRNVKPALPRLEYDHEGLGVNVVEDRKHVEAELEQSKQSHKTRSGEQGLCRPRASHKPHSMFSLCILYP